MSKPTYPVDLETLLEVATQLLMAAVTLRDLAGAMPERARSAMPDDIAQRLYSHHYQEAFDRLPAFVRQVATVAVSENPAVVAAKEIDARTIPTTNQEDS